MRILESQVSGPRQSAALQSMFEARKRVFVDLLGWDVPVIEGRFELDQFDDEHAIYVIVAGEGGEHLGSARLLATTRPHILGQLYPSLCARPVPSGPGTFEITRFCLALGQGASRRREVRNRLVSAIVATAFELGIDTFTGVAEMSWLQQILAFGWDCRPLGPPRLIAGRLLGALEIAITAETPRLLEANRIWVADEQRDAALAQAA